MDTTDLSYYTCLLKSTYKQQGPIKTTYHFSQNILEEMIKRKIIGNYLLTRDNKLKPVHNIKICRLICVTKIHDINQGTLSSDNNNLS